MPLTSSWPSTHFLKTAILCLLVFAHTFLILAWNLMARSNSVGSLMYQHVSWENDSMVIRLPKHKGDQEGKNSYPKHVFANPNDPSICPVLGFAVYVFTKGFQREGAQTLIFGKDSEVMMYVITFYCLDVNI